MRIVVTGASGLLGLHLLPSLVASGHDVIAIARRPLPSNAIRAPGIDWHFRDLAARPLDPGLLDGVCAIVNLVGTGYGRGTRPDAGKDLAALVAANELATIGAIASATGDMRIVYASSQVVYGSPNSYTVDESFPLAPATPYAVSKRNGEDWVRIVQQQLGNVCISLRLTGFIEGGGLVDYLVDRAVAGEPIELFESGRICRDYLTLEDGVQAIRKALSAEVRPGFHAINVGSGAVVTSAELARRVISATRSASEVRLMDRAALQGNFVYDIGLARQLLGFSPVEIGLAVEDYARRRAGERGQA